MPITKQSYKLPKFKFSSLKSKNNYVTTFLITIILCDYLGFHQFSNQSFFYSFKFDRDRIVILYHLYLIIEKRSFPPKPYLAFPLLLLLGSVLVTILPWDRTGVPQHFDLGLYPWDFTTLAEGVPFIANILLCIFYRSSSSMDFCLLFQWLLKPMLKLLLWFCPWDA